MERRENPSDPYRHDVKLFVVLIPVISALNYYLTYSMIQFNRSGKIQNKAF